MTTLDWLNNELKHLVGMTRCDEWRFWLRQFFCFHCGGFDLDRPDKYCAICGCGPEGID